MILNIVALINYSCFCCCYSVADQAWQLLKLYLDRLGSRDGYVYYRCVATKLLAAGATLPTWLVNDYKVRSVLTCCPSENDTEMKSA